MKVYFYGVTLEAAEKKGNTFVKSLKKGEAKLLDEKNMVLNITRVNDPAEFDTNWIVAGYKYNVMVEYSMMAKV